MRLSPLWLALFVVAYISNAPANAAERFAPKYVSDASQVCVERQENNGVLNIVPVTVIVSAASKVTILGGQAGCLFIPAGKETIRLSFPYPYGGPNMPPQWVTPEKVFNLQKGGTITFELCVASNMNVNDAGWAQTGWHDMWKLEGGREAPQCLPK